MPVSVSVSLSRLSVFTTPILAYLFDGETVSWKEVATIVGGFIGVLMIMNPSWFVESSNILQKRSD